MPPKSGIGPSPAPAMVDQAGGADSDRGDRHHQPARDGGVLGQRTGEPLAPAIVWQDRRTARCAASLKEAGHEPTVQARTGLLLDPYFSGSKIGWAMANWPQLKAAGDRLAVGTIEFVAGVEIDRRAAHHRRDQRQPHRADGDRQRALGRRADRLVRRAPRRLPEIVDCAGRYGETTLFGAPIPICGMAGDQQAATIGQACLEPGDTKATFGTGAFVLTQYGAQQPDLEATACSRRSRGNWRRRAYALEGSVFVAGSLIQWLRDSLKLIATAPEPKRSRGRSRTMPASILSPRFRARRAVVGSRGARRISGLSFSAPARISSAPRWRRWRTRRTT